MPGGGDVVVPRDFAQVRVRAGLCLGVLRCVSVEELRVGILGHQVEPAVPQLPQQRGGAADAG
eukprot:CAMPEP_0175420354 /NCGR_PEP_ID=MMETSP0095-20121207/46695_1 /TAXON_ID=311494 /ORGANISM="Alexandrium monilatum, Strain CCMP3105" /LENGTH=62 /DNA_ID=CAMNT_0016719561 /DNA_START=380 /DNA_END=564 /DNA_ORIENTATION=-